jgi:hypothetical protein
MFLLWKIMYSKVSQLSSRRALFLYLALLACVRPCIVSVFRVLDTLYIYFVISFIHFCSLRFILCIIDIVCSVIFRPSQSHCDNYLHPFLVTLAGAAAVRQRSPEPLLRQPILATPLRYETCFYCAKRCDLRDLIYFIYLFLFYIFLSDLFSPARVRPTTDPPRPDAVPRTQPAIFGNGAPSQPYNWAGGHDLQVLFWIGCLGFCFCLLLLGLLYGAPSSTTTGNV